LLVVIACQQYQPPLALRKLVQPSRTQRSISLLPLLGTGDHLSEHKDLALDGRGGARNASLAMQVARLGAGPEEVSLSSARVQPAAAVRADPEVRVGGVEHGGRRPGEGCPRQGQDSDIGARRLGRLATADCSTLFKSVLLQGPDLVGAEQEGSLACFMNSGRKAPTSLICCAALPAQLAATPT